MENPKIKPKNIILIPQSGLHKASFSFYDGLEYAKSKKYSQTSNLNELFYRDAFVVCCGDVILQVKESDFPEIERQVMD